MVFRCRHCGRPVGKGEPRGGDWVACGACQESLLQAGVLTIRNIQQVKREIQQQLRWSGHTARPENCAREQGAHLWAR